MGRLSSALVKYWTSSVARLAGRSPFSVVVELLACLGDAQADGPVLLVVDDLHWADRPSAEALAVLVPRLRTDRVLVLVSTRRCRIRSSARGPGCCPMSSELGG